MLTRLLAALAVMVTLAAPPARADDGANVMLVLDGSGSMWGKVGEQTKMSVARDTVATILDGWRTQDKLGLVAYGHRRKGDCGDIEVLATPQPVDRDALLAQVGAISPKGKTPMTEAMRVAAEALREVEGKASVILVSDGVETCDADPCAVAAELKGQDVDLVVHTVGFDIQDPTADNQLACIAANTGGLALKAADAASLLAAIEKAVAVAQAEEPAPPAPEPVAAEPEPAPEPTPEYNTLGTVRLAEADDPLVGGKEDFYWEFFRATPEGMERGESVAFSYRSDIRALVPPGDYILTTKVGNAEVENRVTINPDGINKIDVVLNAGRIGLRAKRTETQTQTGDAAWDVRSKETGQSVFYSYNPETGGIIPAGEYEVSLTIGEAELKRDVEIAPGDTEAVEIVAGIGKVEAKIVFAPGGPAVKDPVTRIYAGTEIQEGQTDMAYGYESTPKWDFPAGSYVALVEVNGVKRQFGFEVKPGDSLKLEWALDAGLVEVEAPGAQAIEFYDPAGDIYGDLKSLGGVFEEKTLQVMPAGKVKIIARKDDQTAETEVEVAAGKRVKATLTLGQ